MRRIRTFLLSLTLVAAGVGVTAGSAAARGDVLPPATYEAILAVNEAVVPLDSDKAPTTAQLSALRSACKAVPKGGALLATMRRDCEATLAVFVAANGPCATEQQCVRTLGRMANATDRAVRQMVSSRRVIDREVPAGACRTALRANPTEIKLGRDMAKALRAVYRATRKRDPKAIDAASRRLDRIDDSKGRSQAQIRNAIRDRC